MYIGSSPTQERPRTYSKEKLDKLREQLSGRPADRSPDRGKRDLGHDRSSNNTSTDAGLD